MKIETPIDITDIRIITVTEYIIIIKYCVRRI